MRFIYLLLLSATVFYTNTSYSQDIIFHQSDHYLAGKSIIKMCRDFFDPYMWILAKNNEVYRLNTVTKQLDDFSATFQAFKGYNYFDIAGLTKDTVGITAKSADTTVLMVYQSGTSLYPIINNPFFAPQGNVTAIGASSPVTESSFGVNDFPAMVICTNKGFYRYNVDEQFTQNGGNLSTIYSATYRNQFFRDRNNGDTTGTNIFPVFGTFIGGVVNSALRQGNQFGDTILTACFTTNRAQAYSFLTPDVFWGNEKGLFQEKLRSQSPFFGSYKHYLDNIRVNKVTDIFGLLAFGNNAAKENLLIGTDSGLYYTNSFLRAGPDTTLDSFSIYHYNPLGNIPINCIEVNEQSYHLPICENLVFLGTNDGIYAVFPDYTTNFNSNQPVNSIHFAGRDTSINQVQICEGDSTIAEINSDIGTNIIKWFKDTTELTTASGTQLVIKQPGNYSAVLYNPCENIHVRSNTLNVNIISSPVVNFNYPDKQQYCNNNPVVLKTDSNPGFHYRWYTNGNLNGDTVTTYTVSQSGKYKVEVSACTNSWVPSKEIEVDLVTLPIPTITTNKAIYCNGDNATLTESIPRDTGYTINWYSNGVILTPDKDSTAITTAIAGSYTVMVSSNFSNCTQISPVQQLAFTPVPMFSFNYPDELQYCAGASSTLNISGNAAYKYRWYKDNVLTGDTLLSLTITQSGKYKVEVSACEGSWIPSKEVQVNFVRLPVPTITPDKAGYCIGEQATLTTNIPISNSYTINWLNDGAVLAANQNQTSIITHIVGNYTVSVTNNTPNTDGSICTQTSALQTVTFNAPPTVSITRLANTTLCDGETVNLTAHYTQGTVQWSTGQTTDEIAVSASGSYKVTVTTAGGCEITDSIVVIFFPNPVFSVNDTSICTYTNQSLILTAPPGFAHYTWNGQVGNQTYEVRQPQTVNLSVTDTNGCQATRQIIVADQCPDVHIPNTFTPNGDGINDTWNVGGLQNDPTVSVKVFDRSGQLVYQCKGYFTAWTGRYHGKKLPPGTYYYIINAKNDQQRFSGSLTLIY